MGAHRPAEAAHPLWIDAGKAGEQPCRGRIFIQRLFRPHDTAPGQAVVHGTLPLINSLLHCANTL